MRAEVPDQQGFVLRDGVKVAYEIYGTRGPTLVLLSCWIIVHCRAWKAQIADFAQDCRLVVIEGRGNGVSDRPAGPEAYGYDNYVADALAVMDHLAVSDCTLFGYSQGGPQAALIAQARPDQVKAVVLIAPVASLTHEQRHKREAGFQTPMASYEGWAKSNANYIRGDFEGFLRFFFSRMFLEPHSTKQIEDAISWAMDTCPERLIDSLLGAIRSPIDLSAAYSSIRCPAIWIHGTADEIAPLEPGRKMALLANAEQMEVEGAGHGPHMRFPALVNSAIRQFLVSAGVLSRPPRSARRHSRRVLYLSSPIGLGHVRRDLAVARALKRLKPDLAIDWLAQDPVTRLLDRAGQTVHPASAGLALESRHVEEESGEHDLNVFEALRRMDEIQVKNFRVFQEAVERQRYDLVIADESWEVDHFWHEHPQFKRSPLAWMTDFVGFAPMAEGGAHEAILTADYNAEMIAHVEGYPSVRDCAIFVGNSADVVDDRLGPDLPGRREWTDARFAYSGYILGDDVPAREDRVELRARLGFRLGEVVCVVAVGGSAVGRALIDRILQAIPMAQRAQPNMRTIVVSGPRIDPASFPPLPQVEFRGFEPELPVLMAAADLALVQGGLSTCMELAATGTPFLYFPLKHHFEQNVHVPRRLDAYGAGRRLAYDESTPDSIATAMIEEMGSPSQVRRVERDGAECAAAMLAQLL